MHAHSARHRHRHFKTLILLVVSMTAGAFFLFWLGQMTPVTPLRGKPRAEGRWDWISVRTVSPRGDQKAPFHLRIDEAGRLYQTSAWKTRTAAPGQVGTIQVVLNVTGAESGINPVQERALAKLIGDLRKQFGIAGDCVRLEAGSARAESVDIGTPPTVGV
jgi:hypothetical protein